MAAYNLLIPTQKVVQQLPDVCITALTNSIHMYTLSLMERISDREFELMALIAGGEMSGREIAKSFEEETGKPISYGTLYTTLRRLSERGLVNTRDDNDEDGRVRFFDLTGAGKQSLRAARSAYSALAKFALPAV